MSEYLKMADVFPFDVSFDSDGGIGAVVDSQGEYIAQAMENNYCSHMSNKDKNGYRNKVARYVAHSVASHDELVAQRDELLAALHDAATSLETIQLRSFGDDSYLDDKHSMRAYAGARAAVARESMKKSKGGAE